MLNLIVKLLLLLTGTYILYDFFDTRTGWKELSKEYKAKESLPNTFIIKRTVYMNKVSVKGLHIGVSDNGLFLSYPSPIDLFSPALLISWHDISYGEVVNRNFRTVDSLVLKLGNPPISSLELSINDIERIHEDYGETIIFKRLGDPNQYYE